MAQRLWRITVHAFQMKYCCCISLIIFPLFLQAQSHRLEVKPTKYTVDSLENKHLYAAYYLTNKSDDTVNISVTVSFDWCVPRHQPKTLLPGQTDSIVFDCEVRTRPYATSTFTINDDKDPSTYGGRNVSESRKS